METLFEKLAMVFGSQKIELLPLKETWALEQRWRETFAINLHSFSGKWRIGNLDWHVFSKNFAKCFHRERARQAYLECKVEDFILLADRFSGSFGVRCLSSKLPLINEGEFAGVYDAYVFPEDLAWTMAFTHEQSIGIGPFFAMKKWQDDEPPAV